MRQTAAPAILPTAAEPVIEFHGEPFRFWVFSRSRPKRPHFVDLLANGGAGECTCEDWICRRWPRIRSQERTALYCRHVLCARDHVVTAALRECARRAKEEAPCKTPRLSGFAGAGSGA
jgi:hypothetical protein